MGSKLWYLTKSSLDKKIKTKWFVIVNILLAIAIIGLTNIDRVITFFGGDFDKDMNIVVVDNTNRAYPVFQENIEAGKTALGEDFAVKVESTNQSETELTKDLDDKQKVIIVFESDPINTIRVKVITSGYIDTFDYQFIVQALTSTKQEVALQESNIDPDELSQITSPIAIDRQILDETKTTEDENMSTIMGTVFPTVILPFFMLVIFLVQMIGAEICEEKTTRSMEIIISNVSPRVHFFSKILSANIFVLLQGILLIAYGVLGLLLRGGGGISSDVMAGLGSSWQALANSGIMSQLIYIVPLTLVLMLLSFLAYSLVAGILAAMTVNMEDFQQIQTPIIMICLAGYFLAIMSAMFNGSLFIRVLSYVPFISSLLSPALLAMGQIGIVDILISIVIMGLFDYIIIRYGLKIYKAGILNYSNEKVWTRFAKSIKNKDV